MTARGRFDPDGGQLLGASTFKGRLGRDQLVPLRLEGGRALLVDRGWVPTDGPPPPPPPGVVSVEGILRFRGAEEQAWMTPDNDPARRSWFWYDLAALGQATDHELLPVVLEAVDTGPPGTPPVGGRTPVDLPNSHLQYAITWYGLAAALAGVYIAYGIRRARSET